MCNLEPAIQSILERVRNNADIPDITNENLTYSWKGQNEQQAVAALNRFHTGFNNCIHYINSPRGAGHNQEMANDKAQYLIIPIYHVLTWGLPHSGEQNRINLSVKYSRILLRIHAQRNDQTDNIVDVVLNRITEDTPLPSWTKIVAAYDPTHFWIYDTRVAIALRFLGYNWFIPNSTNNLTAIKNHLNDNNDSFLDEKNSYRRYLELLLQQGQNGQFGTDAISTAGTFEKRLFMLGGAIRDRFRAGGQATKNAIIALGHELQNAH